MTILEASRKLNVSKTTIRKYLTPEFREEYCSSRPNGAINISSQGYVELALKIEAETPTENDHENRKPTDRPNRPTTDQSPIIEFLQAQITAMNEQIAKKDDQIRVQQEQISQLTSALEHTTSSLQAAQALHAGTMQKQLLTDGTESDAEADAPESEPVPTKKKHWWNRK